MGFFCLSLPNGCLTISPCRDLFGAQTGPFSVISYLCCLYVTFPCNHNCMESCTEATTQPFPFSKLNPILPIIMFHTNKWYHTILITSPANASSIHIQHFKIWSRAAHIALKNCISTKHSKLKGHWDALNLPVCNSVKWAELWTCAVVIHYCLYNIVCNCISYFP